MHGRNAARNALRQWAEEGTDQRPMVQMLKTATLHWNQRGFVKLVRAWRHEARARAYLTRLVAERRVARRLASLREGMRVWKLQRLGVVRRRLAERASARVAAAVPSTFVYWARLVHAERRLLEDLQVKASIFRRWVLLLQTTMLSRLMLREQLQSFCVELGVPQTTFSFPSSKGSR